MSGDYSRVRFNPRIDIAGVLMQQGRVQLDSDWNEWVATLDRRLRAESVDTVGGRLVPGIAGVAVVSPQTPDGFKIEITDGKITIGRGRMYVDGLLAENHGDDPMTEFDPVLAELQGEITLPYDRQPYYPSPSALPRDGTHLAYLEVWQREITYLQRAELVESAVAVDTTTRLQTAWRVRFLANTGDADCSSPYSEVPGWKELVSPSGGRMSIKAEGVAGDPHPCDPPPASGYSGLENQLYRIEIHDGGPAGTATFKWSRDNASIAANVVEIVTSTELKLASLGRDEVMRFNTGDWVEITDDRRELSGERDDPSLRRGEMRKITVDDDQQSIRFTPALPPDLIPASSVDDTLVTRHTRVRRWDQKGMVLDTDKKEFINLDSTNSGLIPVPPRGVGIILENGIQVQFDLDPADGKFRSGDYWVSAARTADNSVETLTKAPPRGIHRHYARLAVLKASGHTLQDCRTLWSRPVSNCCVELVARPGAGWEKIFDKVSKGSNSVICFPPGDYPINTTITVADKGHLLLYGSGRATRLMGNGSIESVVMFESCKGIDIRDLYVYGGSPHPHKNKITKGLLGTLTLRDIQKIALTRITIRCKPGRKKGMACVRVENKVDKDGNVKGNVKVQECDFYIGHLQIGLLITNAESIRIHSNHFMASGRDVKKGKQPLQNFGLQVLSVAAQAIVIGGTRADHVLIESNEVDRAVQGIHVGLSHSTRIRTVERSDFLGRVILRQNKVNCLSRPDVSPCHGLFVGNVRSLTIKDNHLTLASAPSTRSCDGIRVFGFLGEMLIIRGNHISGFTTAIRRNELSWKAALLNVVRVEEENYLDKS